MAVFKTTTTSSPSLSASALQKAQESMIQEAQALVDQINGLRAHIGIVPADFLVLPLPPTELLPFAISSSKGNAAWLVLYKSLTVTYNSVLMAGVAAMAPTPTSTVLTYDIPTLYESIMATPSIVSFLSS